MSKIAKLVTRLPELAKPQLSKFMYYAKVELRPPTPAEVASSIPLALKGFQNVATGKFLQMSTKEALLSTLIATEVACWFFVGEVIGRGSLVGYDV